MTIRTTVFAILSMFVLQQTQGQYQLELKVTGVTSSEGNIAAALYTDSDSFLEFDKVFKSEAQKADKGTTVMFFSGLPEGEYAVAIFHDSNCNGKLDTNWLGIPKEKVAFSKAKMKTFGPPNFGECAFTLDKDTEINIALND